jgi:hypothetical protein
MLPSSVFVFLSALAVTSAAPAGRPTTTCTTRAPAATPTLPSTGGARELPAPGSAPKQIVVGHGIQNYTCAEANANATAAGALAVLWDIRPLYPGTSSKSLTPEAWNGLTAKVLRNSPLPLNLAQGNAVPYAAGVPPFPKPKDLKVNGVQTPLKFMGHHYFDTASSPNFDLFSSPGKEMFIAKKNDEVPAPAGADAGLTNSGAVTWLQLGDKGGSRGVSLIYRVTTAGGRPGACTAAGQTQSVPYTAMYWLF